MCYSINEFRCYEAKIGESKKAGSRQESNPGHLACAASGLPLSYNSRTTTTLTFLLHSSLAKPDFCFLYESLAVQDYNNKVPDDELQQYHAWI